MTHQGVINHEDIPAQLKEQNLWCVWRDDKIPHCPDTGKRLSTTQPGEWADFDSAVAMYVLGDYLGIGLCFAEESNLVGIDLDDCLTDEGHLKKWGKKVLSLFSGGYIEKSPSGTGLHIIVNGQKPGPHCKKIVKNKKGERLGEIEIYDNSRYFTFTGWVYDPKYSEPTHQQGAVDKLYSGLFTTDIEKRTVTAKPEEPPVTVPKDVVVVGVENTNVDDIVALIKGSSQGNKYDTLAEGNYATAIKAYGDDHSAAVHALSAIVAWYTAEFHVLDKIFTQSPLYTGKWAPNPKAVSPRSKVGKWAALGEGAFRKLRKRYEDEGNYYTTEGGASDPGEDFSADTLGKEQEKGEKDYERHTNLLYELGEPRRDVLSGALHYKDSEGEWHPVFTRSVLGTLRGECQARGKLYKKTKVEDYLHRFETLLRPRLLLDLPVWDGEDRLRYMCQRLSLENVSNGVFEDLFKDWCSKMWQRIAEPTRVQNLCLLLSGEQGVGKDVFIASIFNCLGSYFSDLSLDGKYTKESEVGIVLAKSLVMFISEFEKTESLDVGTLKDIITKPAFTSVRKYDREATTLVNRCSVLGACNPTHIFRDVTGNRRFIFFRLAGGPGQAIDWTYPVMDKEFSLACMAQVRALGESNYRARESSWKIILQQQADATPENSAEDIVRDFEAAINHKARTDVGANAGIYMLHEIGDIISDLARNYGEPRKAVLGALKHAGCTYRTAKGKWYAPKETCDDGARAIRLRQSTAAESDLNLM